jgi:hypothetical protein
MWINSLLLIFKTNNMKKLFTLAILWICFPITFELVAQTKIHSIDYRFEGGSDGFMKFISLNTIYPDYSRQENSFGLSVSTITIKPDGVVGDIVIINPIDTEIDQMVLNLLKSTSGFWKRCDTTKTDLKLYVQIVFNLIGANSDFSLDENFPKNIQFIDPVFISVMVNKRGHKPLNDKVLAKECSENFKIGNYNNALGQINELIKRYPYNVDFYQNRIKINQKLGNNDLVEADQQKISYLENGLSVDRILNKTQLKLEID